MMVLQQTDTDVGRSLTEVVGHTRKSTRHVRLGCFRPQPVLEVTRSPHDREPGAERVVKARCTDDSIDFDHFSRIELDTLGHYPGDAVVEQLDVRGPQRLEIAGSRRDSSRSQGELGY